METLDTSPIVPEPKKKTSQKDAMYQLLVEGMASSGLTLEQVKDSKNPLTRAMRKGIIVKMTELFKTSEVVMKNSKGDSDLKRYCSGLITDRLKKDPRFKT